MKSINNKYPENHYQLVNMQVYAIIEKQIHDLTFPKI